ncbi:MAG: acyl-ACP--UDP-N-acetylglucosamine O-acyltransferase [Pseudomonadota bacterium]
MGQALAQDNSTHIHPTAIVEDGAMLGAGVTVGPFCHVGSGATLHDNVELMTHVVVTGRTVLGAGTRVYPHAVLGGDPQHVGYKGEDTGLIVGKNVVIREGVTMNRGMPDARVNTVVGDNCMFLAYAHVAHDCLLGDHVLFANNVMIGGHCTIGDRVIMGGGAALHQFCRVGHHAFIGGMAGVEFDVIPYGLALGGRAHLGGLNIIGMKRSGMARSEIHALRHGVRALFAAGVEFDVIPYGLALGGRAHLGGLNIIGMKRSGMARSEIHALRHGVRALFAAGDGRTLRDNAAALLDDAEATDAVRDVASFILSDSKRKFTTPRAKGVLATGSSDED